MAEPEPFAELTHRLRLALTVVAAVMASVSLIHIALGQSPAVVITRLAFAVVELPLLIVCVSVANGYALRRQLSPLHTLAVTLSTSIAVSTSTLALFWVAVLRVPELGRDLPFEFAHVRLPQILAMGFMIGVAHLGFYALAFVFPYAAHDARLRAREAERLRTAADLARLRAHLEPHFLLNTLNAIAGLVVDEPREARRLLACLGDLLRDALRDGDEMQTLGQEVAWLKKYAEILESRHKGMLTFEWEIDPKLEGMHLPRLLLQPLVENAVKHGALRRSGGGQVSVRAAMNRGCRMTLFVEDNGPGFGTGPVRPGAVGLDLVRERLRLKLPGADLHVTSDEQGAQVCIDLPLKETWIERRASRGTAAS